MKIRWRINIAGTVHGHDEGARPGQIMDVDAATGLRYCSLGYAEAELDGPVGPPYVRPSAAEMAKLLAKFG